MKKLLLMVAVAVTFLVGSSAFAHKANHGSNHGWNNHAQSHHGHHKPRKARRSKPKNHCHTKRVRSGRHGGGHGHHKRHQPKWKWVTTCHSHRKDRRHH